MFSINWQESPRCTMSYCENIRVNNRTFFEPSNQQTSNGRLRMDFFKVQSTSIGHEKNWWLSWHRIVLAGSNNSGLLGAFQCLLILPSDIYYTYSLFIYSVENEGIYDPDLYEGDMILTVAHKDIVKWTKIQMNHRGRTVRSIKTNSTRISDQSANNV